ncbi:MAG: NTP transferase domain-containing protein [Desulfobulbus sp.]|nr:NTP transferase domain-containing protein [Desulfobulbus sp.]
MSSQTSAIILAGGFSSRMGELKALLPMGKTTVLEQSINLFRSCGINDIVVVTGHRVSEVRAVAEKAGVRPVHNPDFADGMYSSVRAGVRGLCENSSGFFLLPVDISLVRRGTVNLLLQAKTQAPARVFYPVFDELRGHPPLLSAELITLIRTTPEPEGGLRTLLSELETNHPEQVGEVQVADANIHFDMDTPDDYFAGCIRFGRRGIPTMAEAEAIIDHIYAMPEKGLAHGRMVGDVAGILCETLIRHSGRELSPQTCRVCGLLHDIAKGHAHHEETGATWLRELGFDQAAEIVAAHKDMQWTAEMGVGERELVHLADKLVRGSRMIGVNERFEEKLALYNHDPEAVQAILGRYRLAQDLATAVESEVGQPLELIMEMAFVACSH